MAVRSFAILMAVFLGAFGLKPMVAESAADELTDALVPYVKRDYAASLTLLAPLADRGNAVAQLKLGFIYLKGRAGTRDLDAARRWFTKAADQGQAQAQSELGRMYRHGGGTAPDGALAAYWLERAAKQHAPHAISA